MADTNDPLTAPLLTAPNHVRLSISIFGFTLNLIWDVKDAKELVKIVDDEKNFGYMMDDGLLRSKPVAYTQDESDVLMMTPSISRIL